MSKKIGILTSGGDCAGLNAVIRAVVLRACGGYGWKVLGIRNGTEGLMGEPPQAYDLVPQDFTGNLLRTGGTVLGTTNKGNPFWDKAGRPVGDTVQRAAAGYRALGLDALIGIGGDGSLSILNRLAKETGINLIGIPKTIDNDLGHTEVAIGHATAVNVATDALDKLQPTAASHSRVMILEVMGRDAGHIAITAGIAGGADVILIPEIPYRMDVVAAKIEKLARSGRNFALVVVAEALPREDGVPVTHEDGRYGGIGHYLAERIRSLTKAETRVTVLGHLQRGGMPTPRDRLMASVFGTHAVDLIAEERFGRMVAWNNREVVDLPLDTAVAGYCCVVPEGPLVKTARGLGICLGDA
jgi:6-phosphofructokinase 1